MGDQYLLNTHFKYIPLLSVLHDVVFFSRILGGFNMGREGDELYSTLVEKLHPFAPQASIGLPLKYSLIFTALIEFTCNRCLLYEHRKEM